MVCKSEAETGEGRVMKRPEPKSECDECHIAFKSDEKARVYPWGATFHIKCDDIGSILLEAEAKQEDSGA